MANRREQAVKDYGRGRSQAYKFDKRSEAHLTTRYPDDDDAIAESLAAWGYEDPEDVIADAV